MRSETGMEQAHRVLRVGWLSRPQLALLPQVLMKVDMIYEKEMLHLYVLSGIGGLLLLSLIFLALYKVGASTGLGWGQRGNLGMDQEKHTGLGEPKQASAHPILPQKGL